MEDKKVHFRHILLFYFRKGKNAVETHKKICNVYGEDALTERVCQKLFKRFRDGNFDLEDSARSGRPVEVDSGEIKAILDSDSRKSTTDIATALNISESSVKNHLHQLGYVSRLNVWVPHVLTEANLIARISICELLKKRLENESFLSRIVTGDEKWVLYENVQRKRSWQHSRELPNTTAKAGLHPKKVMLSIWWDYKGVIFYELLRQGTTINSDVYCNQLSKLKRALTEKRPELINRKGVIFHHDNARPHTSLQTRNKLMRLGWEVLPTHLTHRTLPHQTTTCSCLCRTP